MLSIISRYSNPLLRGTFVNWNPKFSIITGTIASINKLVRNDTVNYKNFTHIASSLSRTLENVVNGSVVNGMHSDAHKEVERLNGSVVRYHPIMSQQNLTNQKHGDNISTVSQLTLNSPFAFKLLINNPSVCIRSVIEGSLRLLVYVHSASTNLKKRQSIRQTWGSRSLLMRYNSSIIFVIGVSKDVHHTNLIRRESEEYSDIIQAEFIDSYRNLSKKGLIALRWIVEYCPHVDFILKTDDDILVDIPRLFMSINSVIGPKYGKERVIVCHKWINMGIIREKKSKWYISEQEIAGKRFPPYCSGSAFLLSGDMPRLMYEASLTVPFVWIDDYYITGAIVNSLNIQQTPFNRAYCFKNLKLEKKKNDTSNPFIFYHVHKLHDFYKLWEYIT